MCNSCSSCKTLFQQLHSKISNSLFFCVSSTNKHSYPLTLPFPISTMPTTQTFVFPMYLPLFLLLTLSPFCGGGDATKQELWCVAKNNAEDAALQSALDWACGAGGADCRPIQNGGPCYDVNSVQNTASFAFNDYFLKNGLTDDSCNFSNNAAVTSIDPSQSFFLSLSPCFVLFLIWGYLKCMQCDCFGWIQILSLRVFGSFFYLFCFAEFLLSSGFLIFRSW